MLEIVYLADRPDLARTLATWHFGQWGHWSPHRTVDVRVQELQAHLQKGAAPTTFVALDGGEPVGSASLLYNDLPTRTDLNPWLASVFVPPNRRRSGVGRQVVRRVMDEAGALGLPELFLFTPDREAFYQHLGWRTIERSEFHDEPIVIMRLEVAAG